MAQILPPTVHERLARCNERVFVDGIVPGALVELQVGTAVTSAVVASGGHTFTVPPLVPGEIVRARQDDGSGFTPFSDTVTVEDAFVPPQAEPTLPEEINVCSQCVLVTHATPGALIEVFAEGAQAGVAFANRHGTVCVGVDLTELHGKPGTKLQARQVVCGAAGPFAERTLIAQEGMPKPVVGFPVFGCQSVVPVTNARAGALLRFESDSGDSLGQLCSCWTGVNVRVIRALVTGEHVRAQSFYDRDPCVATGLWSDWRLVEQPDDRIKPEIREVVYEGDQTIRVSNQIQGATLTVLIADVSGDMPEEFGPRPVGAEEEISLGAELKAGNEIVVVQRLCGVSVASDPVVVAPLPPEVLAPVLIPPMFHCGNAVQVSNLHPGALVRVFMDGVPVGVRWAGLNHSIPVPVSPHLAAGRKVTATQTLGGKESLPSEPVEVQELGRLQRPRIIGPVAEGDREIWVSGVMPGARVSIRSGGILQNPRILIGEMDAAEPVVRVPIDGIAGAQPLLAAVPQVRFCGQTATGDEEPVILSPLAIPGNIEVVEEEIDFGNFNLPASAGGFSMQLRGHLYRRKAEGHAPLVVIAHGFHSGFNTTTGDPIDSAAGYGYLARHLVKWGMTVFSVDLQPVNDAPVSFSDPPLSHRARAEAIFRSIALLQVHPLSEPVIDASRIGLVGHSMGAEAVAFAQVMNADEGRGLSILGVASIAPTNWIPDFVYPAGKYMELFGAIDQLTGSIPPAGQAGPYGGLRLYDRAEREKTFFWLHGMRHNPFNSEWVGAGDFAEEHLADISRSEGEHQRAAKFLVNAFFQDALMGRPQYGGYMHGIVFPHALAGLPIHTSHSEPGVVVIDNFGDKDDQAGLAAETPSDRAANSLAQVNDATGGALAEWSDQPLTDLDNAPHESFGTRLAWDGPDARFAATLNGLAFGADKVLSLRLAQFYEDSDRNAAATPTDMFVSLEDGNQTATLRLGCISTVPFPDASSRVNTTLRSVRLPFDAFWAANPALDRNALQRVTLRFDAKPKGHILGDDFEIGD